MTVRVFSTADLDALLEQARRSPRRRRHFNIHSDYDEPCQRLLNAMCSDSYIRPHRHFSDPKTEMLMAVRGSFVLVIFDDGGSISQKIPITTEASTSSESGCIAEIPPATWHTVIATEYAGILLETKAGPFKPDAAKDFAAWAPAEGTPESVGYLAQLYAAAAPSV